VELSEHKVELFRENIKDRMVGLVPNELLAEANRQIDMAYKQQIDQDYVVSRPTTNVKSASLISAARTLRAQRSRIKLKRTRPYGIA
jgi:hypothetical protein